MEVYSNTIEMSQLIFLVIFLKMIIIVFSSNLSDKLWNNGQSRNNGTKDVEIMV